MSLKISISKKNEVFYQRRCGNQKSRTKDEWFAINLDLVLELGRRCPAVLPSGKDSPIEAR